MANNAYDPFSIAPDWDAQKEALHRAYKQGLINLDAKKGNLFAQQGLKNKGSYSSDGRAIDFSNLEVDPNQEHGGYRDELKTEADMLDAADNGPSRGFSGGVANQAARTAKIAVAGRQNSYQQNLQQALGNMNMEAGNQAFNYAEGVGGINQNAAEYGANQAAYNLLNAPIVVPGASGGGSVPTTPSGGATPLSANAIQTAASYGYSTTNKVGNLKPVTFGPAKLGTTRREGAHGVVNPAYR